MQTADRRCTTRKRTAPGTGSETARVYERPRAGRRNADRCPCLTASVPSPVVRRTIAAIGRMLVTLGLLILLFVTYELWGTGIFTARAQTHLKSQFHQELPQVQAGQPGRDRAADASRGKPATRPPRTTINPKYAGRSARGRSARRDRHQEDRRRLGRRRGRAARRPREGPGPLPGHAAARARSATPRSPGTARRTAHPSSASTSSRPATRS